MPHDLATTGRVLLVLAGGLAVPAAAQGDYVVPPTGWVKGETHEHLQFCPQTYNPPAGAQNDYPLDKSTVDVLAEMVDVGMQVANVMIWSNGALPYEVALAAYGPLVTGSEDLSTAGDPDHFIQVGVESSGFPVSALGHVSFLNVSDPFFDPETDLPFQLIDWFKQQPGVVVGAPHQLFPIDLCEDLTGGSGSGFVNPPGYDFVDTSVCDLVTQGMAFPTFTSANLFPVFLPMDIASGRVDYLEAIDMTFDVGPLGFSTSNTWNGLYYKLLNLGLRPSIGGGNDVNCAVTTSSLPARTYVWMDEDVLDFPTWSQRLADGHVTLSMGDHEFLSLDVQGARPGEELQLNSGAQLPFNIEYAGADGYDLNDTVEILVNGLVVSSFSVLQPGGGSYSDSGLINLPRSSWVAARTVSGSAHTGAVFVTVDAQPRADLDTANYMVMYTGYLDWNLDVAVAAGVVEDIVGDSLDEARTYIDDARRSFVSRREFAEPLPAGVTRYGRSARAAGSEFMPIVLDEGPVAGETRTLSIFNAPPGGVATLVVSGASAPGTPIQGARMLVDLTLAEIILTAPVDDFGHAELDLLVPPSTGATKYMQFVVFNPPGFPKKLSSSDAISVTY